MEKKTTLKQHRKNKRQLEEDSKPLKILKNLFQKNKKDIDTTNDNLIKLVAHEDLLFAAYEKLRRNKGSTTPGTIAETADGLTESKIEDLSIAIKIGEFKWTSVRKKMIPKPGKKEKRPLGIPNFRDRIVQECIRLVLESIYEPIFQIKEHNHGFRPKRSTETAMIRLQRQSKEMYWAIEGDIKSAYPTVNHALLLKILSRKIKDKKFLNLIKTGLEHNIVFEGTITKNLLGTPQGGIVSPILFNIYMHEFDCFIDEYLQNRQNSVNVIEKRTKTGKLTRTTRRLKGRVEKGLKKISEFQKKKRLDSKDLEKINQLRKTIRISKTQMLSERSMRMNSIIIRFSYTRYADDWIILTNGRKELVIEMKKDIQTWLRTHLKFELDEKKTKITNLETDKALFLGFSIFRLKKRIIRKSNSKGLSFRQRSTVPLTIGIDHERVRSRLIAGKIMNEQLKPRSNPLYIQMHPVDMVTKYKQRVEGLFNYYYRIITFPNELNLYYYTYKFSCLKTLGRRLKKSIKKITMERGKELEFRTSITEKTLKGEKTTTKVSRFPTYKQITTQSKIIAERKNTQMYNRMKKLKESGINEPIEVSDIIDYEWSTDDPFSMSNIAINLRTQYLVKTHCSICGAEPTSSNPIEMHHLKHIRKGKVTGFSQVMKSLNRKTIPTCRKCHNKIHKGVYDGISLNALYDVDLTQV